MLLWCMCDVHMVVGVVLVVFVVCYRYVILCVCCLRSFIDVVYVYLCYV